MSLRNAYSVMAAFFCASVFVRFVHVIWTFVCCHCCPIFPLFNCFTVGGHLGCFWFGAVMNTAAVHILVCVHSRIRGHVWEHTKTSAGLYIGIKLLCFTEFLEVYVFMSTTVYIELKTRFFEKDNVPLPIACGYGPHLIRILFSGEHCLTWLTSARLIKVFLL